MVIFKNGSMDLILLYGYEKSDSCFMRCSDNELIYASGCVWDGSNVVSWRSGDYRGHIGLTLKEAKEMTE
jgi:hypothetical protein